MTPTPIPGDIVRKKIRDSRLACVGLASIRELNRLVGEIEAASGRRFIRMEMGIPGLAPPRIAVEGEVEALRRGVGATYPPFDGIAPLKAEIARFVKLFLDVAVQPAHCLPTVGSMQGCFLAMMMAGRRIKGRDGILFIDPGFPVNKKQARVLGLPADRFDVYDFRGDRLRDKLESLLSTGRFGALMYSNPNNPSWICFTEKELGIIGDLCSRHDVVALEDLAYFGMDFRQDCSRPGSAPFIPTVARYTDNYILLISSSKSFSLAGQRIGMTAISDALFDSHGDGLPDWFETDRFGYAYIFGGMYALSSGVCHSTQYGLVDLLKAVNNGTYNFVDAVRVYGERARAMKRLFTQNGFRLVYDMDEDQPLADGFYFTVAYPGFSGVELVEELLYYGISAISLATTGSSRTEGIRACVSLTGEDRFDELEDRLRRFDADHQTGSRPID
ncbi:MAG TPA: pyridoxal phosphate-dependent aminotransferase [Desulfosarcina sp.]|nr:pyridoxal phosphate-dependent aminotransferase [Desulfosarcina sp.]